MNPNRYTEIATAAGERYQTVLSTFRSMLLAVQAQPFSKARITLLRAQAVAVGNVFLVSEREHIASALLDTAEEAIRSSQTDASVEVDPTLQPSFEAYLGASESFLESEVRAQLSRDVEALVQRYRQFAVEADMLARSKGMPMNKAIAHVGSAASDRMRFQFRDRVGRLYPAQKFIRSAWRHTMVAMAAEFYMLEATSRGATKFVIEHPDPSSKWAGYEIDPQAADFLEVRDEVFHPNSNATVRIA